MSKEPRKRWLLGWMDVVLKQEESRESGQGGYSKVGRTTTCVGLSESEQGLQAHSVSRPHAKRRIRRSFIRPHVASPRHAPLII